MEKPNLFLRIATVNARNFCDPQRLPPGWETQDVVQELVLDLLEKHKANKFSTEEEAWVICLHKLFNLFASWAAERRRQAESIEDVQEWASNTYNWMFAEKQERGAYAILQQLVKDSYHNVRVTGEEVARATSDYRKELQALRTYGLTPLTDRLKRAGFLLTDGTISPRFLARLTKALIAFGATPRIAKEVVKMGLYRITSGQVVGRNWTVLNNYRKRAGKGVTWESLPGGDILLRRGRFRLFIERA